MQGTRYSIQKILGAEKLTMAQLNVADVRLVVIIAAYNESENLPYQLQEIFSLFHENIVILIMDDSGSEEFMRTESKLSDLPQNMQVRISHIGSAFRSGRGAAVKRGMKIALEKFPNLEFIIESDADGSHRAEDIFSLSNADHDVAVLVGSRYLDASKIEGWTTTRRLLSRVLNYAIPRILGLPIGDVTNGLRRYSRNAVEALLENDSVSTGFIYLTEQMKLLQSQGFSIMEVPTIFKERRAGVSTVTLRELRLSALGLINIIRKNLRSGRNG